jgi:hypothetical protein
MQNEYEVEILSVTANTLKEALDYMIGTINPNSELMHRMSLGKCRLEIDGIDPSTNKWRINLRGYQQFQ